MTVSELRKSLRGVDGALPVTFFSNRNIRAMQFDPSQEDHAICTAEVIEQRDGTLNFTMNIEHNENRR
ncbi:hypothetical protein UFOVP1138_85 [uncultured Caudovirales phage]|uniref:Uncharacterized protein n=1 Tax=uncultured Caudovirales phage TaxID=2100421 RepID=A0A6J5S7P1_9CAUD|nr:hypothetical protein UFOVP975_35 [uncultured Caudovirales phage]CAB4186339.1 hypothetical protein UFOVP1138_85 [uncultured Caudovirales phage]CAB4204467.1 hypothetical protein UFOVP1394_82 [uncultured Caudovirales phage]